MNKFLKICLVSAAAVCTLAPPSTAQAGLGWVSSLGGWGGWGALEHGNGDKVTIGRFNTLHTVWEQGGLIKYATSADGMGWSSPELVASGIPAALPTIASNWDGTLVVAFVANPDAQGMGPIHYARKAWGATSWTHCQVVTNGTQPDIEVRGSRVYLTWTTIDRVQFTSFPMGSPPAPMTFGEEIEVSSCPDTGFVRPSVVLVRESCKLVPKVAYLRFSDETTNPDPSCAAAETEVGPRVCRRDPTSGVWSLEYTDLVTETFPPTGVEAVSLSMNAQYSTGNTYLAWSDSSNGNERTRLAHGRAGAWDAVTFDTVAMHAHVAAKRSSLAGDFRLAWVPKDGFSMDFVDWDTFFRTGSWSTGATPTWTDPSATNIPVTTGGATAGRPQATYWGKCSSGNYVTAEAVAEVEGVCGTTRLMSHYTDGQTCPGIIGLPLDPCMKLQHAVAFSGKVSTHVDVDELGSPSRIGRSFVEYTLGEGRDTASVTFSWDRGQLGEVGETGFVVDDPQAKISVQADGVSVKLERLADNYVYDEIRPQEPTDQCNSKR